MIYRGLARVHAVSPGARGDGSNGDLFGHS